MKPKIYIRDKIYIPIKHIDVETAKDKYTKRLYDEKSCAKCEYRTDRHSFVCDTCPAFKGCFKFHSNKEIKGDQYIGLPIGDKDRIQRKIGIDYSDFKIVDQRTNAPFDYKLKWLLPLYPNQEKAVGQYLKKKYGLLRAPPRTGKSAMSLYISLALGQKTLILAHQHEFLDQFQDHIHGNEKEGIPKCTNLPELEKKYKKKLYGFPKTKEDYENFQIFFSTYQQFISDKNGKARIKKLLPYVGTIFIDEIHRANTMKYASVIQKFKARYKGGVTATDERKDNAHFIIRHIVGPVVAESHVEAMVPTVYLHKTGTTCKQYKGIAAWVRTNSAIANDKKRNKLIVDQVMKDLDKGHNIVIPIIFKKHALLLKDMINKAYGKKICEVFLGGGTGKGKGNIKEQRKEILQKVKANKLRVTVGMRQLVQVGLNVPSWSLIMEVMPISNKPNLLQETSRIRTPKEGKQTPIIRVFVDDIGLSIGCARNSVKHMKEFKYNFSKKPSQQKLVNELLHSGKKVFDEDDQYKPTMVINKPKKTLF